MSPGPRRERLEAYMGVLVAAGIDTLEDMRKLVAEIDSDLWAYLLNRVLAISVILEGVYLTLALSLKRYRMAFNIVLISLFYIITAIYWRWEWL